MSIPDIQHPLGLLRDKRIDDAIEALERKVEAMPAHLTAYVLLARAYESRRRWGEALRAWKSAHMLMPTSPLVREGRERVLERLDEIPEPDAGAPAGPSAPDGNGRRVVSAEETMADALTGARAPDDRSEGAASEGAASEDAASEGAASEDAASDEPGSDESAPAEPPAREPVTGDEPEDDLEEEEELPTDLDALDEAREALNLPAPGEADAPAESDPAGRGAGEKEGPSERKPSEPSEKEPEDEAASGGSSALPSDLDDLRDRAEREARQGGARPGLRHRSSGGPEGPDLEGLGGDAEGDGSDDDGDLDRLIEELESARIDPSGIDPTSEPEAGDAPEPDLESDVGEMVSETLARIYANQGQYRDASRIYVKLAARDPERIREYLEKAASMREKADRRAAEEGA
jgi:tetratricopeptide (TPR) repeat protein